MMNFDFSLQTRLIFGKGRVNEIGKTLSEYRFKKILFVYGRSSIKRSGLYELIVRCLNEEKIIFHELSGIAANPDVSFVKEGLKIIKKDPVDCILAVGGGSVIDVAKSLAVSYFYNGDPFDFNSHKAAPAKALPVAAILTIASAGSEMSDSCVINNYETKEKSGFNSSLVRPLFAIEDPALLLSVPSKQRNAGIVDMMMHSMERYFAQSAPYQLADSWALGIVKNIKEVALALIDNPNDEGAIEALMLDSSLAHSGLTSIGKKSRFAVHPLEHAMSALKPEITHGEGIAVAYLGWAKYIYREDLPKFARFSRYIFDVFEESDEKAAIMGIASMGRFYRELGVPTSLSRLGLHQEDIPRLAAIATGNGTRVIGCCPRSLNKEDVEAVYRLCLDDKEEDFR